MSIIGMDVEAVESVGKNINNAADQIQELVEHLSAAVESVEWRGPDRERFVADWQSNPVAQAVAVTTAIRDAGIRAQANAEEQRNASNSG